MANGDRVRIGFIGFGEAAYHLAAGLASEGADRMAAYDEAPSSLLLKRARDAGVTVTPSASELADRSDLIVAAVPASAAEGAARSAAASLRARHLYVDVSSCSPASKRTVGEIVTAAGATFVEAVLLGPVPRHRHRVPMLLGGPAANRLRELLAPFGMRLEVVHGPVGTASAIKLCRSVVVKGMEALLLEALSAARRHGAEARVLASLNESLPGADWVVWADYLLGRTATHATRRAYEMEEAAEAVAEAGVEPLMARATAHTLGRVAESGIERRFPDAPPGGYADVLRSVLDEEAP